MRSLERNRVSCQAWKSPRETVAELQGTRVVLSLFLARHHSLFAGCLACSAQYHIPRGANNSTCGGKNDRTEPTAADDARACAVPLTRSALQHVTQEADA